MGEGLALLLLLERTVKQPAKSTDLAPVQEETLPRMRLQFVELAQAPQKTRLLLSHSKEEVELCQAG